MNENPNAASLAQKILSWYDQNARDLPWRVAPAQSRMGVRADPYHVWLSEIMLQQTTVEAVRGYFTAFIKRWPDLRALAGAEDGDVMGAWAGLGYYARARNLLKCARLIVRDYDGHFPEDRAQLLKLPGIGPYTAAAISAIAFDRRAVVIDGNVNRVMARLHCIQTPLPKAGAEIQHAAQQLTPHYRVGDYAQALMDLGATICKVRSPDCAACPWQADCGAHRAGCASELPRKLPKKEKPLRHGIAYIALRKDGAVLLEQRPNHGLLGGMLAFPATAFIEGTPDDTPPIKADWMTLNTNVEHVFTHFRLQMQVQMAQVNKEGAPTRGAFISQAQFDPSALPTVMAKAWRLLKQ